AAVTGSPHNWSLSGGIKEPFHDPGRQKPSQSLSFMVCSSFCVREVTVPELDFQDGAMSNQPETALAPLPPEPVEKPGLDTGSDRRSDIDAKMTRVASILQQNSCDGLLLLDPDNVSWLTSGATARGILDPREQPGIYCTGEARWLLCSNVDTQRTFDEELDGLGFQLKEWPYHWGRDQLVADLCQGRRVASDVPLGDCVLVSDTLRQFRRQLTSYEQASLQAVGMLVSHAIEATCRTLEK